MKRIKYIFIGILIVFWAGYGFLYLNYYPPIFMYHQVNDELAETDTISVSEEVFSKQMAFIQKQNYKVVSLEQLCEMVRSGNKLPHNLAVITFDDGYRNNLNAVRILNEYHLPATIFMPVNWVDKEGYLKSEDINWITENSNVSFGSHTLNHSYLPGLSREEAREEILESKNKAEEVYNLNLVTLAYPVGGFNSDVLDMLKEAGASGYVCACTTNRGYLRGLDIYALRRIKVTNKDLGFRLWVKLTGFYNIFRRLKPPSG